MISKSTGNLDSPASADMLRFIADRNDKHGQSIIWVARDLSVRFMRERVVFFREGQIAAELNMTAVDGKVRSGASPERFRTFCGGETGFEPVKEIGHRDGDRPLLDDVTAMAEEDLLPALAVEPGSAVFFPRSYAVGLGVTVSDRIAICVEGKEDSDCTELVEVGLAENLPGINGTSIVYADGSNPCCRNACSSKHWQQRYGARPNSGKLTRKSKGHIRTGERCFATMTGIVSA
ncbi:hypothetical protein DUZ99_03260 [Xylanibacillus composti]|uniref:hypothetical protein n=1 Tax=Xylanibacillus composti TaxID=1572762 RepID=UPI001BD11CA2|nr:hypothetical protein [Xylanibacillus composti]MDT9724018.1 hypothetical protein [Xylanibacillus composti]